MKVMLHGNQRGNLWILLSLLVFVLSGCDVITVSNLQATPPAPPVQPIIAAHQPYRMVEIWLAATTTYPREYFSQATQTIAQAIDNAVQPNSDGMVITIGLLRANSFDPSATVLTITIPKIDADPSQPVLATTPTPLPNPFANQNAISTVEAINRGTSKTYQQALQQNHTYLAQVRKQVRMKTDQLRALDPPAVDATADFWGAVGRSAGRFKSVSGQKQLIMAMDFENITWQQFTPDIYIPGVAVSAIYTYCNDQPRCEQTTDFWKGAFIHAGATSANFYDPVQSQQLSLFS
jgi:hypothetical protein